MSTSFVLVTGGLGFIGSHATIALLEHGYNVLIFDNLSNTSEQNVKGLKFLHSKLDNDSVLQIEIGDLRNNETVSKLFEDYNINSVIHFAALKSVNESIDKPLLYYDNNINGVLNLLTQVASHQIQRFIFSSSATVYGSSIPPFDEHDSKTGIGITNPYGRTKQMTEEILKDLFKTKSSKLSVIMLRYFNPIGAHPSGFLGEVPNGTPNNLFPYILDVAQGKRNMLHIFGADYPTYDGTCLRDYIHVMDLASGHIAALQFLETIPDKVCEVFNLGTGKPTSVLELIHTFEDSNEISITYTIVNRRPGDVAESYAVVEKAKALLNWEAKYNLEDMCKHGWNFRNKDSK
jgi:UDP-glucose 4-epimerase